MDMAQRPGLFRAARKRSQRQSNQRQSKRRIMGAIVSLRSKKADRFSGAVEELAAVADPWEACRRLGRLPHVLFLDSAARQKEQGRYSFLMADPFDWVCARGTTVHATKGLLADGDPFRVVAEMLSRFRGETDPALPPFQGGAAGLFGYDLCHHLERLPRPACDDFAVPDLALGFYDWVLSFDHESGRAWIISSGFPETAPRRRSKRARQRLMQVRAILDRDENFPSWTPATSEPLPMPQWPVPGLSNISSNFSRARYLTTVERAIEYIHAGDCFQVNLAQRLLSPAVLPPWQLYERLRQRNPSPFAGYFDLGDFVIASASPERFLCVRDMEVETRPIKGTRPRDLEPAKDQALRDELLHSAKDRAENVMIVDLLRNDLGRVCDYGSVRVAAVCRLESQPYVHHLVSEVRGRLRPWLGPIDLLRAAFPGGSVTGAPKIRAMEIIAELEPTARGPYTGCLGYIGFNGAMDSNLLIRTFVVGRGWVQFCVGGGIVADSDPEREYQETWHKARGLLKALDQ